MADYLTTDTELISVANAIRTKGGTSAPLVYPAGFISAIQNIPSGGSGACTKFAVYEADSEGSFTYSSGDMITTSEFISVAIGQGIYIDSNSNYYCVFFDSNNLGGQNAYYVSLNDGNTIVGNIDCDGNTYVERIVPIDSFATQGTMYIFIP